MKPAPPLLTTTHPPAPPQGWPQHESPFKVAAGSGVTITTSEDAAATPALLPITYPKFPSLVQPGDIV